MSGQFRWKKSGGIPPSWLIPASASRVTQVIILVRSIPVRQNWRPDRPVYGERLVVPTNARVGVRIVAFGHLIENFRAIRQGLEAMREAPRDVQRTPVVFGQLHRQPLADRR